MNARRRFATIITAGIALLAFSGCVTTLREVRSQTPVLTTSAHRTPATFLACVREHIEEHHSLYQSGNLYEVMPELDAKGLGLIARTAMAPTDVRFVVTAVPGEAQDTVTVALRMSPIAFLTLSQVLAESAAREAIEACRQ
jgi:hypothetical protein